MNQVFKTQKSWRAATDNHKGSATNIWNNMAQEIRKVVKDTFGESKDFGPRVKESWWWNENIISKVRVEENVLKNGFGVKLLKVDKSIR